MSSEITVARSQQYSQNVFHLSQQKMSRLRPVVRNEMQRGKSGYYDRLGASVVSTITSRHADTVLTDTPHSRRRVTLVDKAVADMIDDQDKVRMLWDPSGPYAQSQAMAMSRAFDDIIIEKALGTAYAGEEGGTAVTLPDAQRYAALSGTAGANANVAALRKIKSVLDAADVDESIPRYYVHQSSQLESLLGETEVTSSDYATVKALVQGEVDTFLGFKFIRIERLPVLADADGYEDNFDTSTGAVGSGGGGDATGYRRTFAFASDGLLFAQALGMQSRITERDDKNYNIQVHTKASFGATRMEEEKLVELLCNEA